MKYFKHPFRKEISWIFYLTGRDRSEIIIFLLISLFTFTVPDSDISAQTTYEWPSFHGADRTNKSAEKGLLKECTGLYLTGILS